MRTSQPASVSMGEPQLPSWTNSHEYVGLAISSLVCQKWSMSEYIKKMFSLSCRESMA